MAKGRPKGSYKYNGADLLPYLSKTPKTVQKIMEDFNKDKTIKASWITVKRALEDLHTNPVVEYRKVSKYHIYRFTNL